MKLNNSEKTHFLCELVEGDLYSMPDFNDKKVERDYCTTMALAFAFGLIPIQTFDD